MEFQRENKGEAIFKGKYLILSIYLIVYSEAFKIN